MGAYLLRRLLLIIPTLIGIMVVNFTLTQFVPGGPIEQIAARLQGEGDVFRNIAGGGDAGAVDRHDRLLVGRAAAAIQPREQPRRRPALAGEEPVAQRRKAGVGQDLKRHRRGCWRTRRQGRDPGSAAARIRAAAGHGAETAPSP